MDAKAALDEYAKMIRIGSHALKGILNHEDAYEGPINEVLFMLDRFEELASEIERKDMRLRTAKKRAV